MKKSGVISKVLATVLALAMILSLLPVISFAAESYPTEGAYVFSFSDSGITVVQEGKDGKYKASGTELKIQAAGTYIVSGSCAEGFIQVSKSVTGVTLVLNGLTLTNSTTCPLSLNKSTGVTLVVAPGTVNTLTDNAYNNDTVYADNADAENAVIKCKDGSQVTICGTGTLNLNAKGERGIKSGGQDIETVPETPRDAWLIIKEATINITATAGNGANGGDAIKADQLLKVLSGNLTLSYVDDGLKSDADLIVGEAGTVGPTINMLKGCEGIEAVNITCYSGDVTINVTTDSTGGGGNGIKADSTLSIIKGKYTITCNDDAIKSEYYVYIGAPCSIEGPTIDVKNSYEGIEGAHIYIYGGDIDIYATDDAMNAANSDLGTSSPGAPGGRPGSATSSYAFDLQILGGNIYCDSQGDGLDSNKALTVRGGNTVVLSSTQNDNSALDVDGTFSVTGGRLLGVSKRGMFSNPTNSQYFISAGRTSSISISAGSKIYATNSSGTVMVGSETTATRSANFIFFSSPELANSSSNYTFHYGNSTFSSARSGNGVSNPYVVADHSLVTSPAVAATCTSTGLTEGSYCQDCGTVYSVQQEIPMLEHVPVDVPAKAATCTEKGNTAGTKCSLCDTVLSGCEKIKKLGHDIEVRGKVEVTCTTDGFSGEEYCLRCETVVTAGEVITAPGHTVVTDPSADPTCTAPGKTEGSSCSVCGEVFSVQTDIPATGHTVVIVPGTAATCTAPGKTDGKYCSVCNEVLAEQTVIAPLGHTSQIVSGKAATCLSSGLTDGEICSTCGIVLVQQTSIPRLGHSYIYTDNGDGTHTGVCERCDKALSPAAHTEDANGVCTACNAGGAQAPTVDSAIVIRHTLNLASDISINYAVATSQLANYDSFYLDCVLPVYSGNEKTGTKTIRVEPVLKGNFYYFTLTGITAIQIGDEIEATLYMTKSGANYVSNPDVYSVATYAYTQMAKIESAADLKTLCADLLVYGSAAQTYKKYRTDSLCNSAMTAEQMAYCSDLEAVTFGSNNAVLDDIADPQITWAGKSLNLESKVVLKFVMETGAYTGKVEDLTLRVTFTDYSGAEKTVIVTDPTVYNGTRYAFDFDGLLAAELRTVVKVAVFAGEEQVSPTLCYSADTYGNNRTGDLLTLCKALVAYSDSAKTFFVK